jgi:hypothetical protein
MKPESFFEIELKSLLNKNQYERLYQELPQKFKIINKEKLFTTRFRPGDIRLRYSDKTWEIISKEGDPCQISRKEVKIPLQSKEHIKYFEEAFLLSKMQPDPTWEKDKMEFIYPLNGFQYIICLQHIHNFAYILEVEYLSESNDILIHEPNLRKIFVELNCQPINPKEFSEKIKEYIKLNSKK